MTQTVKDEKEIKDEKTTKKKIKKPKDSQKPRLGSYSHDGKKVTILRTQDKHKLWADLFDITQSQIELLKQSSANGGELDPKEMSKLDSCFNGIKRLIEIEGQLKSDAIASMSTEDLFRFAKKAIRERVAEDRINGVKVPLGRPPKKKKDDDQ